MAYSVMVWMVDPGMQVDEIESAEIAYEERDRAPGASTGINMPPAHTRMVYGVYEQEGDAENALTEISDNLQQNAPLRLNQEGGVTFLIPADRVHYVACSYVERPKDRS